MAYQTMATVPVCNHVCPYAGISCWSRELRSSKPRLLTSPVPDHKAQRWCVNGSREQFQCKRQRNLPILGSRMTQKTAPIRTVLIFYSSPCYEQRPQVRASVWPARLRVCRAFVCLDEVLHHEPFAEAFRGSAVLATDWSVAG